MGYIGYSLLLATLTVVIFYHPPSTWSSIWRKQESILKGDEDRDGQEQNDIARREGTKDKTTPIPSFEVTSSTDVRDKAKTPPPDGIPGLQEAELDRKAMPPPPFISKPTIAAPVPIIPTFNDPEEEAEPAPVSFPALNSAQRASGGRGPSLPASRPVQRQPPLRTLDSGLMPPPSRPNPLPNRGPPALSSSLALPPSHTAIPTKPSKKVLLAPGHSPLDWARLTSDPTVNLRGVPADTPYLKVPMSEVKKRTGRKGKDAWTVYLGKVYNITPYLPYHPGGEPELMRCAGRDGTKLFNEVHPWVNWEGMLGSCLVGVLVSEPEVMQASSLEEMD